MIRTNGAMYEPLRRWALAVLKVPPEPHPPVGDPALLRVFRAGRNYFRLRLGVWAAAQILALAGILFWTATLIELEAVVRAQPPVPDNTILQAGATAGENQPGKNWVDRFTEGITSAGKKAERIRGWGAFKQFIGEIALLLPPWAFPLIWILKISGLAIYLLQIPITYAVRRLDYELRWYMVTDRSLRLRHGVWNVLESTMSFANIQQVVVSEGPLQRLLGLADVRVQSAGGGSSRSKKQEVDDDMHLGLFHSVTNAPEIRDLILERLRRFRESGLGDPDEKMTSPEATVTPTPAGVIAAAQELLAEAKALRGALSRPTRK